MDNILYVCDVTGYFSIVLFSIVLTIVYYILTQSIKECALFKGNVYFASKRLQGKELERGTIFESEQTNQSGFFVAKKSFSIGAALRESTES